MLKVTEIEETIGIFIIGCISIEGGSWLRLWLWGYSGRYIVLVLRCHYSPCTVFSIKINFKINVAQKHNNQIALHNLMTSRD